MLQSKVGFETTLHALESRVAELEGRLNRINDLAATFRDQVGTGGLVANISNGFQTILDITRGTDNQK